MMQPIVHFSRRYHFSSSHRLHVNVFTDEQNDRTFGKCNNPHGHGHNYVLELTVCGPVKVETGMVVDVASLDRIVRQRILDRFDTQNLNCDPLFKDAVSSTENVCRAVWDLLRNAPLGAAALERLRIEETGNNFFEYAGKEN